MASNLNQLLSSISYQNPHVVREHLSALQQNLPSLTPNIGTLIHNDGLETTQVVLSGTVPIIYKNVTYNIPVDVFILAEYPVKQPLVYVRPTSNMMIKPSHSFVDNNGYVNTNIVLTRSNYIHGWMPEKSHILDLIFSMCTLFGTDPPLFTRPANSHPGYATTNTDNGYHSRGTSSSGGSTITTATPGAYQQYPTQTGTSASRTAALYSQPATTTANRNIRNDVNATVCVNESPGCRGENAPDCCSTCLAIKLSREEAQQREILYNNPTRNGSGNADGMQENLAALSLGHGTNPGDDMNPSNGDGEYSPTHRFSPQDLRRQSQVQLVAMLKEKLSLHLAQMSSKEDFEIQSLLNQKDILKQNRATLDTQYEQALELKTRLEKGIERVKRQGGELDQWLDDRQKNGPPPLEDRLIPFDELSEQIVTLKAEDETIDDTIFYLERALASKSNRSFQLKDFVHQVRQLLQKQFEKKYHLNKIKHILLQRQQET